MEFSGSNRPVSGYHHHKAASSPSQYSAGCIPTEYHAFQSFKTSKANCTNRFVPPTYSNQIQYCDPKIWFKVHLKFYFLLPCMSTLPLPSGVWCKKAWHHHDNDQSQRCLQSDTLRLPKANRPKAVCECKCEPSVAQKSIDHRESLTRVKPLLPRANSSALFSCLAFFFKSSFWYL